MYPKQAGHMSRPPSPHRPRLNNVPLSLRTQINPTQNAPQQQAQSSSPPNASIPKPISSEKFTKALKLYTKYCLEKGLAQQATPQSAIEPTTSLNIPLPTRARSLTSRGTSRAYTPSVSNSAYDGVTDISSVVSFGEESVGSGTPNGNGNLINFSGEVVKQRTRRPLTPVSKAKAALIRHLGSCKVCNTRRVGCDLEHHDIASLEKARKAKDLTRQRAQLIKREQNTTSHSLRHASVFAASAQQDAGGQTSTLFLEIGQNDELLRAPSSDPAPVDPQSPSLPDYLSDMLDVAPPASFEMPYVDPYMEYQDGQMFVLGHLRDYFYVCAHRDGCQQAFDDAGALQIHFETHFPYNRITPAHRYICLNCECMNNYPVGPCSSCGTVGSIELRIYGSFIRTPIFQRNGFDGQDFLRNDSAPYYPSMDYGMGNIDMNFGLDGWMGSGNYTGGMNNGNFFQNNNNFEDSGAQGGEDTGYSTPRSGGHSFQGNWTRNRAKASPFTPQYLYAKALQTYRHHKLITFTLMLLVAFTLLFQVHEWLFTKARISVPLSGRSHPNLPAVGFAGVLVSFATYWGVKKAGVQRVRRTQCVSTSQ